MRRALMSIAILCAFTDAGVAQQPSSTPVFDATSVKASPPGARGWSVSYTLDSLRATNVTLAALIQSAYGIRSDRLVGGPNWVQTTRFEVTGRAAEALPREQLRLMAQHLLEDRFGVVLRREQRAEEAYILRVARSDGRLGPDLRRAAEGCSGDVAVGGVLPDRLKSSTGADPTFSGRCTTMRNVATGLSRTTGFDVVDQTGLDGRWDFVIAFAPLRPDVSQVVESAQANLPTVFVAVEEQLGLKLERNAHGTVEYVVIAAAHAPTEN